MCSLSSAHHFYEAVYWWIVCLLVIQRLRIFSSVPMPPQPTGIPIPMQFSALPIPPAAIPFPTGTYPGTSLQSVAEGVQQQQQPQQTGQVHILYKVEMSAIFQFWLHFDLESIYFYSVGDVTACPNVERSTTALAVSWCATLNITWRTSANVLSGKVAPMPSCLILISVKTVEYGLRSRYEDNFLLLFPRTRFFCFFALLSFLHTCISLH